MSDSTTIKVTVYLSYKDGEDMTILDIVSKYELERDIRRLLDPEKLEYKPDAIAVVDAERMP